MRSAYDILGVPKGAGPEEIRAAYRELARDRHPDLHGGSSEANERFLELRAAYELLRDPERRRAHDADPEAAMTDRIREEQRLAQRKRRRERLKRLYEE